MKRNGARWTAGGGTGRVVSLPRGEGSWTFHLRPLPLGFSLRLREQGFVPPARPTRVARDASGKVVRDAAGLAVLACDDGDADYQKQLERYHQRLAALMLAEGLSGDPEWGFEAEPPRPGGDWARYADRLLDELAEGGFTEGDLAVLCREVLRTSNLLNEAVQEAASGFFSGGRPGD